MYVAILIQYAAFIVAAFFVYRVACSIFSGKLRPALVFVGYAFSISFIYDQEILTDSLFNNLFVITTCAMAIAAQRGRLFCGWALLALGFVALAIVLTRPIGLYLSVVFLPVFFLLARFVDAAPRWRVARGVAAFYAPTAIFVLAMTSWNAERFDGERIFVSSANVVALQPLAKAAARGHDVFDGDGLVDETARALFETYSYPEVLKVSSAIEQAAGGAIESSRLQSRKFFQSWIDHPLPMIENTFENFDESIINQFFNFPHNVFLYLRFADSNDNWPGLFGLIKAYKQNGDLGLLSKIVLYGAFSVVAWIAFLLFALGPPILLVRAALGRRRIAPLLAVTAAFWIVFFGYVVALCMIHYASRFTPAVLPGALMGAIFVFDAIRGARRPSSPRRPSYQGAKP